MWNCFENVLLLSPVVLWVSMTFLKLVIYDLTDKVESTKGNNFKLCKPTTNANIISLSLCLSLFLSANYWWKFANITLTDLKRKYKHQLFIYFLFLCFMYWVCWTKTKKSARGSNMTIYILSSIYIPFSTVYLSLEFNMQIFF